MNAFKLPFKVETSQRQKISLSQDNQSQAQSTQGPSESLQKPQKLQLQLVNQSESQEESSSFALSFFREFLASPKQSGKASVGRPGFKKMKIRPHPYASQATASQRQSLLKNTKLRRGKRKLPETSKFFSASSQESSEASNQEIDEYKTYLNSSSPSSSPVMKRNQPYQTLSQSSNSQMEVPEVFGEAQKLSKRELKAAEKQCASRNQQPEVLTSTSKAASKTHDIIDQMILELHLKDFVLLADNFAELQRKQLSQNLSVDQREPLRAHLEEVHQLLRYLTKMNTQKKLELQQNGIQKKFCAETKDLALKSLVRDLFKVLSVDNMQDYRQKYKTLGDYLQKGAKPQSLKLEKLAPKAEKLASSRSSPLSKTWKGGPQEQSSQCHVSTTLPSLNGEDSHDWCGEEESSPGHLEEDKVPRKLLFGAPNSARNLPTAKEECFGHEEKSELTAAP